MIHFGHLLESHSYFDVFWKTVLERLSICDPPFFSDIHDDEIFINGISTSLKGTPYEVVKFCRAQWDIPEPCGTWRAIKKEHTRLFLLKEYVRRINPLKNK